MNTSNDTIERLEELLELAREGELTGIAIAAMLKDEKFVIRIAGDARSDPTLTRGMVAALDDELRRRVRGE